MEAELDNWLDPGLQRRFDRLRADLELRFRRITQRVRAPHADDIEALEQSFAEITDQLARIGEQFEDWETEADELWDAIAVS